VLVFGEDETDRRALKALIQAVRPDSPRVETRRSPLVLVKGRARAEQRKNAAEIARVVRADQVRRDVRLVVAHEDADDVEPAHAPLAAAIEAGLTRQGIPCVAAVPAWEIEAWWYLWPTALLSVNSKWLHPNRSGKKVGLVRDAKEQLIRDLRPKGGAPTRDYQETDGPRVAEEVRRLKIVRTPNALSDSFRRFLQGLDAAIL
jgi:hypothetical protein